ncbi:ciliary-associated calcium-binding coiled-coil protein 1 isoform X2 [Salminus brasiliensis]|uniref:ciliary-associated calcium-binding coiled-coil protein 1 isoform X2 n=1 Tax=Salminus brasiliensis TaxID=930266 RepID=UPI003B834EA2
MTARNAKTAAVKRLSSTVCETVEMFPQWTLLSQEHIAMLLELSVDQVQLQFEDALGLKKQQTCLKEAALLDYFVAGFWWAKEVNFTCQQISFFMALLQLVLDNMKEQQMPFAENFKAFTQNLLATRKSSSVDTDVNPLFDLDQIKSITDYFKSSLFQHYRLYQFLFTQPREEMLLGMERSIEVANSADFAAPLEEGMSTELYFRYMAPAPDASPPQSIQGLDECLEKNEEEPDERQQGEAHESPGSFSVEDADFTDRLRIQEESYISRLDSLKRVASK